MGSFDGVHHSVQGCSAPCKWILYKKCPICKTTQTEVRKPSRSGKTHRIKSYFDLRGFLNTTSWTFFMVLKKHASLHPASPKDLEDAQVFQWNKSKAYAIFNSWEQQECTREVAYLLAAALALSSLWLCITVTAGEQNNGEMAVQLFIWGFKLNILVWNKSFGFNISCHYWINTFKLAHDWSIFFIF